MFKTQAPTMRLTLRVLAHLLRYPDADLRAHLGELADALRLEAAVSGHRLDELQALIRSLQTLDALQTESEYVELFDRGRSTALHLFEHVHGDSRDRGPAMIDLIQTYEQAGLYLGPDELPDHLPVLLEFASTQPPQQARHAMHGGVFQGLVHLNVGAGVRSFFSSQTIFLPRVRMIWIPSSSLSTSPFSLPIPIFQYWEPGIII